MNQHLPVKEPPQQRRSQFIHNLFRYYRSSIFNKEAQIKLHKSHLPKKKKDHTFEDLWEVALGLKEMDQAFQKNT